MAGNVFKLISDLPASATTLAGTELVEIQNGSSVGASQQTTTALIAAIANAYAASVATTAANTAQANAESYTNISLAALTTSTIAEGSNEYFTEYRNARSPATALTNSSGTVNIDLSKGSFFTLLLAANVTAITFTNLPATGLGQTIAIRIQQNATGGFTLALPASFHPTTGSLTTIGSSANSYTLLMLTSFDQGTRWEYSMQTMVN